MGLEEGKDTLYKSHIHSFTAAQWTGHLRHCNPPPRMAHYTDTEQGQMIGGDEFNLSCDIWLECTVHLVLAATMFPVTTATTLYCRRCLSVRHTDTDTVLSYKSLQEQTCRLTLVGATVES